jgi:hypothetical protein
MSQTVTFVDGQTAVVRDPKTVPVKVRRVWEHANAPLGSIAFDIKGRFTDEEDQKREFAKASMAHPELVDAQKDASILALVESWSYGEVSQAVLESLPAYAYDKLAEVCEPLAREMSPNFQMETDPKADVPAGTPTGPVSVDSVSAGMPIPSTPFTTTPPISQ